MILNAWFGDSKSVHFKVGRITSCQIMLWFDLYQPLQIYPTVEHRGSLRIILMRLLIHKSFSINKMLQIVDFCVWVIDFHQPNIIKLNLRKTLITKEITNNRLWVMHCRLIKYFRNFSIHQVSDLNMKAQRNNK